MAEAFANEISVETPEHAGVRVDHPRIVEYIRNCLRLGFGNQEIVKRVGCVPEQIQKVRAQLEKEKAKLKSP